MEKGPLIGTGRTAQVFAWGDERILKLYQNWMPAVAIEREFAITRTARETGLPVPAAEEIVEVDGRKGIVFERVQGPSMLNVLSAKPWTLIAFSRQLGELHARMHACKLPPETYTQRQQIERGIELAHDLADNEKKTIRQILERLPEGDAVCHGDFHPDNILLTTQGPVIIDWMTATRGHPQADVARTALLFHTGGLPPNVPLHMRLLINASRAIMFKAYLDRYLQLNPVPRSSIHAWQLPMLAARLFEVENYPGEKKMILAQIRALQAKL
jgi:uncharacterized protein (TIGR02172 family)